MARQQIERLDFADRSRMTYLGMDQEAGSCFGAGLVSRSAADEGNSMSRKPFVIDLSQEDGQPHWLSSEGRHNPNRQRDVHKKHRDAYLARKKKRSQRECIE